jgi:hypothetical protein
MSNWDIAPKRRSVAGYKQLVASPRLAALRHQRLSPWTRLWRHADLSKADAQFVSVVVFELHVAAELRPFADLADT